MATLGSTLYQTFLDLARKLDPDGKIAKIAEIMEQYNEVLDDMLWKEGNLPTGEKTTIRTGLPAATWRKLNYGVQPSKSTTAQITDSCGMLEAYSEVDKDLADLNGNTAEFRLTEDRAQLEGMNQTLAATIFYGDTTVNPERFVGLAPRYAAVSGASRTKNNVLDAGGTGSTNTSVWLCHWGPETMYGIYPRGSMGGFQHRDLGEQTLWDNQTPPGKYQGYRTHYKWDCGLTVRDWRFQVRIANIDVALLTKNASAGADLIDLMEQAFEILPARQMGTPVFYCNKTIKSFLRRQMANKSNARLNFDEVMGKHVLSFDGTAVRRVDQILNTESRVV
jgi:major capsid protein gp7